MANETVLTIIGNLVDDPVLKFTPSGTAVASFRVASTPRFFDKQAGQMVDGDPVFMSCNVWRDYAEHVCDSLSKGARVIVHGRLQQRSFEASDGSRRQVYEIEVDEVGPALRFVTAEINRDLGTSDTGAQNRGYRKTEPAQTAPSSADEPPF